MCSSDLFVAVLVVMAIIAVLVAPAVWVSVDTAMLVGDEITLPFSRASVVSPETIVVVLPEFGPGGGVTTGVVPVPPVVVVVPVALQSSV